jgi:Predicted membrane protein (DUF2306)
MLLSCIGVAVYATRYFLIPPNEDHFSRYLLPLRLHIAGGMGALPAGPWQFSEKLRTRALNWHRWLGRFYLLEVALGSIAGLVMAMVSEQGPAHALGVRHVGLIVVFRRPRSLPHGSARKHRRASPMDDSQFRFDPLPRSLCEITCCSCYSPCTGPSGKATSPFPGCAGFRICSSRNG